MSLMISVCRPVSNLLGGRFPPPALMAEASVSESGRKFAEWVARHPWWWGLISGAVLGAWGWRLFGIPFALIGGGAFGALNVVLWRRGGPGNRWRAAVLKRFPDR